MWIAYQHSVIIVNIGLVAVRPGPLPSPPVTNPGPAVLNHSHQVNTRPAGPGVPLPASRRRLFFRSVRRFKGTPDAPTWNTCYFLRVCTTQPQWLELTFACFWGFSSLFLFEDWLHLMRLLAHLSVKVVTAIAQQALANWLTELLDVVLKYSTYLLPEWLPVHFELDFCWKAFLHSWASK